MTSMIAVSAGTLAAIAAVVVVDVVALSYALRFVRAGRARAVETERSAGPRPVTRREFFRRSLTTSLAVFGAQFGGATLAFLWPRLGAFGSVIPAGAVRDIKREIAETHQPVYSGQGRFYVVRYDGRASGDVDYERDGLAVDGLMALYQRCAHLGCRVPFCVSSQWFECPCHQSKYNGAGEYRSGPAPRGLDRFRVTVDGDQVLVDTSQIIPGPPRGIDTTSEPVAGPFCVASA